MRELALTLLVIVLYGSATFFKRLGLATLHPYQFILLSGTCYALLSPIWAILIERAGITTTYDFKNASLVVVYAIFSVLAGLIVAFLLRTTQNPGVFIVLTNLSSFITLILCCLVLNEQLNAPKILGIVLAILSLILMNF